jgi:hypothetical protein
MLSALTDNTVMINDDIKKPFEKDYPNKRTISLWFMRLILSQYKSKNCSQNMPVIVTGAKIVILQEKISSE